MDRWNSGGKNDHALCAGSGVNSGRRGRVATGGGPDGVGVAPAAWTGGIVVVNDHALCPGPHT